MIPNSVTQFLLESSICLALFYALYYFWLRQETFFQINRLYLLMMPVVSLAIPLLRIEHSAAPATGAGEVLLPVVEEVQQVKTALYGQLGRPTPAFALTLGDLLFAVYLAGALFALARLGLRLYGLWSLIHRSQRARKPSYTLLAPERDMPVSSFFSYIFWKGNAIPEAKRIVLEHELVHVRQRHSLDVLLMEGYVVFKWFNPLIYAYRTALQQVHEYIADAYVSRQIGSRYAYARFLAAHQMGGSCHPLANTFAAHLRHRLQMLGRGASAPWRAAKYFSIAPLLGLTVLLFSFNLADQLPGGGLERAGQAIDQLASKEIYTQWGEAPGQPADGLVWGPYRLPVFAPGQLKGSNNELHAAFLSTSALEALQYQRFELVQGDQVLWRKATQGFLYEGERLIRKFAVNGKLKDCWPVEAAAVDELVLVLVMEDAWSRKSSCIIGIAPDYTDALRVRMMGAAGRTCFNTIERSGRAGEALCISLPEHNIQIINAGQPWEISPYRLELGPETLGVHWYNDPAFSSPAVAPQRLSPKALPIIRQAPFRITYHGRPLALEQLYIGLTSESGEAEVLEAVAPRNIQQTWRRAVAGLNPGDQLHLIARAEGEKAFHTSVGIGVEPNSIPGFRTIERLRHESGRIVPETAIGRVDLLHSDYINTDTIPEWFEFHDQGFSLPLEGGKRYAWRAGAISGCVPK